MSDPIVAVVAFAAVVLATPLVIVVANRTGIVDRPGALKPQSRAVPYLGGVAVLLGVAVGAGSSRPSLLAPIVVALVLGVADDRFDLPAPARLVGQLVVGALVVVTCPVHLPGAAAWVLIACLVVLLVNGVNLIDGLDMLAAGVVGASVVGFAIVLHGDGRTLSVAVVAALCGFLCYNRPPARIYLGDGGSYLLGAVLSVLVARAWAPGRPVHLGVAVLCLVAVPVGEVAFAIVRRARARRSLLAGDRGHPYDRLVDRGWPRPAASLAYVATGAVLVVATVLVVHTSSLPAAVALDICSAAFLLSLAAVTGGLVPAAEARP